MKKGQAWTETGCTVVPEGSLRPLSAWEVLALHRESLRLARDGMEQALCSNACLVARVLERQGRPVFKNGRAVLKAMPVEEIIRLADCWGKSARQEGFTAADTEQGVNPGFDRERFEMLKGGRQND